MALHISHEALALRWAELCNDPTFNDLPYKVELNAYGTIELSPGSTRHGMYQARIASELMRQLPAGVGFIQCAVATQEGVRVPDVAWASADLSARHDDTTPLPQAPEICVEVRSLSDTDAGMAMKTKAYLAAGAVEVWIVSVAGAVDIFDAAGFQPASRYGVRLTLDEPR